MSLNHNFYPDKLEKIIKHNLSGSHLKQVESHEEYVFSIIDWGEYYRLSNIPRTSFVKKGDIYVLQKEIITIDWLKEKIDNGKSHTNDEWAEFSVKSSLQFQEEAMHSKNLAAFVVGTSLDYMAVHFALNEHNHDRNHSRIIEKIIQNLSYHYQNSWFATLSRVIYLPHGKDQVIHNYSQANQSIVEGEIAGQQGYIRNNPERFINFCRLFCGCDDIKKINDANLLVSNSDTYAWPLNKGTSTIDERAVVIGVGNINRFDLNAINSPNTRRPAIGIRINIVKKAS